MQTAAYVVVLDENNQEKDHLLAMESVTIGDFITQKVEACLCENQANPHDRFVIYQVPLEDMRKMGLNDKNLTTDRLEGNGIKPVDCFELYDVCVTYYRAIDVQLSEQEIPDFLDPRTAKISPYYDHNHWSKDSQTVLSELKHHFNDFRKHKEEESVLQEQVSFKMKM